MNKFRNYVLVGCGLAVFAVLGALPAAMIARTSSSDGALMPVEAVTSAEPQASCAPCQPKVSNEHLRYLAFERGSHVVDLTFDYSLLPCGFIHGSTGTSFKADITLDFASGPSRFRASVPIEGPKARFSGPVSGNCSMPITIPGQATDGRPRTFHVVLSVSTIVNGTGESNGVF